MKLEKLYDLYEAGKVSKRLYWELARERLVPLLEMQRIVKKNPYCRSIEIREDGIVLKTQDIAIFFDMTQNICRAETILIGTEGEEIDFISRFIPAGATIFDIGANVGRVSLGLAKAHEDSTIYAFEPVEETFRGLEKNLEAASLRPITDTYYFKEGDQGQGECRDRLEEIVCPVDTLDDFVEKHDVKRLDFIKCDTEGAEKMVFSGGIHVFRDLRPVVYTEMLRKHAARFDYHPNEIIEMFKGWGYGCYTSENEKLIPFEKMDESTTETNFFFLHGEKHRALLEKYGD